MRFSSVFSRLLKGKLLVIALVSIAAIGGTAVMAASTPGGQHLVHALVGLTSATSTPAKRVAISRRRSNVVAHPHWRRAWRPIYLASMLARAGVMDGRRVLPLLRRARLPLLVVGNRRVLLLPLPTDRVSNECRCVRRMHSFSGFAAFPIVAGQSTKACSRAHIISGASHRRVHSRCIYDVSSPLPASLPLP